MTRAVVLTFILFLSACSYPYDCENAAFEISILYEEEWMEEKEKNRTGYIDLFNEFSAQYENSDNAFQLLESQDLSKDDVDEFLNTYGAMLLQLAVIENDNEKVKFYLEKGVNPLEHQKYIGLVVLELLDSKNIDTYEVFSSYFNENKIESDVFSEVSEFYEECVSKDPVTDSV